MNALTFGKIPYMTRYTQMIVSEMDRAAVALGKHKDETIDSVNIDSNNLKREQLDVLAVHSENLFYQEESYKTKHYS